MKLKVVHQATAIAAVGLGLAGCGGGGGSTANTAGNASGSGNGGGTTPVASLQVGGTAATGAALASAKVDVKCKTGSGTATTTSAGAYTVSMEGGVLPCIVQVTGTSASGAAVTLHSVVETGTSATGGTAAVANVTPITEMIVAQLLERMPSESFATFDPAVVTQAALASATTTIVEALKSSGVDLGSIDPLKGALVPPSGSTAGNAYDDQLEKLALTVAPESLPLLVNQIATAAAADSTAALGDAMAGVSNGAAANCPAALSGKYRTIDYTGGTQVHAVDFKTMTWQTEGESAQPITAASQPCEFTVGSATLMIGPQGAGAFREADTAGYVFPVQAHPFSAVVGTWKFVQSGLNESDAGQHWFGKFTFNADGTVSVCDHNIMGGVANFGACVVDTGETATASGASDGGFQLGGGAARMWGYKGPNGVLSVFGTNNPTGTNGAGTQRTSFVMVKPDPLPFQAVGTVLKVWDLNLNFASGAFTTQLSPETLTITGSDATAGTVTRTRERDGRVDTFRVNYPVEGIRYRAASTGISAVYSVQVPDLGMSISLDDMPGHFFSLSVNRP